MKIETLLTFWVATWIIAIYHPQFLLGDWRMIGAVFAAAVFTTLKISQ